MLSDKASDKPGDAARPESGDPASPTGAWRLGVALFLLSTATVLFTLATFKLLSFFIMPSLFFDLLFVGFPIGAFVGARFFRVTPHAFRSTLWILQIAMFFSVAAALWCKHFDYLRAHLFEVDLLRLLIQMGTFTGFFIPFFCAYGLSEYLGYQIGRRHLAGRMPLVYGLYLFGAAFAYFFIQYALPIVGISRILCLSIVLITGSSALLSVRGWTRWTLVGETVLLVGLLFVPDVVEQEFLTRYKGEGGQSTFQYERKQPPFRLAFQEWGDYSLTEVMYSEERDEYAGFYNDLMQWEYSPQHGFVGRSLGMVPINIAPRDGKIAIVGAGGGRQVRWAQQPRFRFREIVALELEPAVFHAIRGDLAAGFGHVYEADNVSPIRHEARSYMEIPDTKRRGAHEKTDGAFDLIYMPSVGGYPQMMLEPGNMIRTVDAYVTLRNRLSDRGILAIWYPAGLDPQGVLTTQYLRTLSSEAVGLHTKAYTNPEEYLILAARDARTPLPDYEEIDAFLTAPEPPTGDAERRAGALPPNPAAQCFPFFALPDPLYKPISDNQPFLAGNVRHIFSLRQVVVLFSIVAGLLVAVGAVAIWVLRKAGNPQIPGRSYWHVAAISFLVGANFLVFEHCVILALFQKMYVFHDALVGGAISFLILSGLGSVLITPRLLPFFQAIGGAFVLALLGCQIFVPDLSPVALIALAAPVAFVTGSFFPALFELSSHNPLAVFALDALGAGIGSMLAFFLPIAFGFHVFFPFAAVVFLVTCAASWLFFRGPRLEPLAKSTPSAPSAGQAEVEAT